MTYVAASMSMAGAIPQHLPAGPLVTTSFGSSFASKLAPAGIGGMALNVRFLQKQGVDQTVAVSGVGLNTIAGLVGHITLVGIFLIWAGRDAFGSIELPDPKWFLVGIGVAAGLFLVGLAIPSVRSMMRRRLLPVISKAFDGVSTVLRRPGKVALLLGGSILVTFSYLTTLYFSIAAFGGGLAFATVGAVFLVGSAIAQAAPTPGGLGAVEAALIAGLVAAGLDNTDRRPSGLPLPPVHVLGSDPAGLARIPMAGDQRVHLTGSGKGQHSHRLSCASPTNSPSWVRRGLPMPPPKSQRRGEMARPPSVVMLLRWSPTPGTVESVGECLASTESPDEHEMADRPRGVRRVTITGVRRPRSGSCHDCNRNSSSHLLGGPASSRSSP